MSTPSIDPLFKNKFATEFESLKKLIEIAQGLLADAVSDPTDDKLAGLASTILTGAVELSRKADLSLRNLALDLGDRISSLSGRIGKTLEQQIMLNPKISSIMTVAERAIVADRYATAERYAKEELHAAYAEFKEKRGVTEVERDGPLWFAMMEATKPQYEALTKAKRDARNAQRRLATTIRKNRHILHSEVERGVAE